MESDVLRCPVPSSVSEASYLARFSLGGTQCVQYSPRKTPGRVGRGDRILIWAARSACITAMGERPGALTAELLSALASARGFFIWNPESAILPGGLCQVQHCTWLGEPASAASGTEACRRQWRKQAGGASGIARSACATMRVPRSAIKPMTNARESRTR